MNVGDCMNRHLVYLRAGDRAEIARRPMLDLGLSVVPVLDDEHRPVGVVSLRDFVDDRRRPTYDSSTVRTVTEEESIEQAAKLLVTENVHHLVVVDAKGAAVGTLSTMDVVRGLVGVAPQHPASIEKLVAATSQDIQSEYRSE